MSMTPRQLQKLRAAEPDHGNRIRAGILILKINQAELSRRAGVRPKLVNDVCAGRRYPKMENARKLSAALGARIEDVFPYVAPAPVPAPVPKTRKRKAA